jgi:hypothetical protein
MVCSHAESQLNALLDGELPPEEHSALDAHLSECTPCREALASLRAQDERLRAVFSGGASAAARISDAVAASLAQAEMKADPAVHALAAGSRLNEPRLNASRGVASRPSPVWQVVSWLAAAAAGFLLAVAIFRPWNDRLADGSQPPKPASSTDTAQNSTEKTAQKAVARLVVATGPVEILPASSSAWSAADPSSDGCSSGSTVRTAVGASCEFQTPEGGVIRINDDSQVVFRSSKSIELHKGQLWCSAPEQAGLEVVAIPPQAEKTQPEPARSPWTFSCPAKSEVVTKVGRPDGVQVTIAQGEVDVRAGSFSEKLRSGETMTVAFGKYDKDSSKQDPLLDATWIHPLLVKKGHAEPELIERVNELLARLGQSKAASLYEDELRRLGEYCVLPLLRYVQSDLSQEDRERRQKAMRIAADLSPAWAVEDLISLLADSDGEVRYLAANALTRLTSQTHGRNPDAWRSPWADCQDSHARWQAWWAGQRHRYPSPDFLKVMSPRPYKGKS